MALSTDVVLELCRDLHGTLDAYNNCDLEIQVAAAGLRSIGRTLAEAGLEATLFCLYDHATTPETWGMTRLDSSSEVEIMDILDLGPAVARVRHPEFVASEELDLTLNHLWADICWREDVFRDELGMEARAWYQQGMDVNANF